MVTIGEIDCWKNSISGDIRFTTTDIDGNKKEFVVSPSSGFKNEAESVLWTMVNNTIESKDKPTYEEAIEQNLKKNCSICGKEKYVEDFNRNKNGKYGARPECKHCQ